MTNHDVLIDRFATVFAVNCEFDEEEEAITIGALYLEPDQRFSNITLTDRSATIEIELPLELLEVQAPQKAWNIQLPAKL